jgi:hypothetical protein
MFGGGRPTQKQVPHQLICPADAGPRGSMRLLYGDDDAAASMMNGVEQQAIKVAALLLARIFGNIEQGEF